MATMLSRKGEQKKRMEMCKLANKIQASGWLFNPNGQECVNKTSEATTNVRVARENGVRSTVAEADTLRPRRTKQNKRNERKCRTKASRNQRNNRTPRRAKNNPKRKADQVVRTVRRTSLLPQIWRHYRSEVAAPQKKTKRNGSAVAAQA